MKPVCLSLWCPKCPNVVSPVTVDKNQKTATMVWVCPDCNTLISIAETNLKAI